MKSAFHILFALYFAFLAVVPCGDKEDCNDLKKSELCQTSHEHDEENHEDESCTPFCTCSCCAALFLLADVSNHVKQVAEINSIYTIHKASPETGAILPIWQPPKIS